MNDDQPASPPVSEEVADLQTLNQIAETLNQSVDVRSTLESALSQLVVLMGLKTAWIFLVDQGAQDRWAGRGYVLAAHHQLPPALVLTNPHAWGKDCDCQSLCKKGKLVQAYNEVKCSRLAGVDGEKAGLVVHASTPLQSGQQVLGILNVAVPAWSAFNERSLALLTNVGSMMGIALERARLFDLMQEQRIHEQAALLHVSGELLSRRDLDDLMNYLVTEVQRLLDVDACALLLPDEDDRFLAFRAASGWQTQPVENGYCVPADERSGSGLVMRTQRPLLTTEQGQHSIESLWMSDWLQAEGFESAAIVPLVVEDRSIGTLVIDTRYPRRFEGSEIRFLQLMANQAAIAIDRTRLRFEEIERHRLEKELAVGRQIQLSMLPPSCPTFPGWDVAAAYEPAQQVGGDFYDFFELPHKTGHLGLVIADVSDKGVPAALFMTLCRSIIRNNALRGRSPAMTLTLANQFIQEDSQSDMFITAFYGVLTMENGRFTFANAGHNRPLWWQAQSQSFTRLRSRGIVLGVLDEVVIEEQSIQVAPGDVLIFYTDGITEAVNQQYEEFGEDRLQRVPADILTADPAADSDLLVNDILQAVRAFTDDMTPFDDATLFVVRRIGYTAEDAEDAEY